MTTHAHTPDERGYCIACGEAAGAGHAPTPMKIWTCKIGEAECVPGDADFPMRGAVAHAYRRVTGQDPKFLFSGWGSSLTEPERAVVENRAPSEAHYEEWQVRNELVAALGKALEIIVWMSGSDDFSPNGKAHEGWITARAEYDRLSATLALAKVKK